MRENARDTRARAGPIIWCADAGGTYADTIHRKTTIEFPDGIGRPPGSGKLAYDGFISSLDEDGFVSWAAEGDPIWMSGNFENEMQRICDTLT